MSTGAYPILRFEDHPIARIWGGRKFEATFGKILPPSTRVGEDWLISDHPNHESVVADGPHTGKSLRKLMEIDAAAILGTRVTPANQGRFPLILKLLDAADRLSIQVHPDDDLAREKGGVDTGKTEMWHVIDAERGSRLYCGLDATVTREQFIESMESGTVADLVMEIDATPGASVFVPAGTVHSIGAGVLLAEIQQNSDLTYRISDWDRVDANGKSRPLHPDDAPKAVKLGSFRGGLTEPLRYSHDSGERAVLAACPHFASELISVTGRCAIETRAESFHIILAIAGSIGIGATESERGPAESMDVVQLEPGEAGLIPGCHRRFTVNGDGRCLHYFVPNLDRDIIEPLRRAGHARVAIDRLVHT